MSRRGVIALAALAVCVALAAALGALVLVPDVVQVTEPQEVVQGRESDAATTRSRVEVDAGARGDAAEAAQAADGARVGDTDDPATEDDVEFVLLDDEAVEQRSFAERQRATELFREQQGSFVLTEGALLVTRDGAPAAGVRVRIFTQRRAGGRALADLRTDAEGLATLPSALVPAPRTLVVLLEASDGLRVQATMEVGSTEEHVDLSGAGVVAVYVVDLEGAPVGGARVRGLLGALVVAEARTDDEGRALLACDTQEVEASDASGRVARAQRDGDGGVTLVLRPGRTGAVDGRVLDADGRAVDGAVVRATWPGGDSAASAATNAQGAFRLEALPAGRVSLEVWTDASDVDDVPVATGAALVDPDRDARVDLRVVGAAALEVQVVDGSTPVAGARVSLTDPAVTRYGDFVASGAQGQATTGPDGRARLSAPAGRWYVRTVAPNDPDRLAVGEAIVEAGATTRVVLDLAKQRWLDVRVVDLEGRPVPGVFMDASMPGVQWDRMPAATTKSDGVAHFDALPPGVAELHLGLADQWRMLRTSEQQAEFVWTPPVEVRLAGLLEDGPRALRVVTVLPDVAKLIDEDTDGGVQVVLDPEGARLDGEVVTPGGAQQVFLAPADPALAPLALGVVEGPRYERLDWRARFPRAASVSGRLVDARGAGAAGTVTVEGALGGALAARAQWLSGTANDAWVTVNEWAVGSGPDGLFELSGLPPGQVTLLLQGVGCSPRRVEVDVAEGARVELGEVGLHPR